MGPEIAAQEPLEETANVLKSYVRLLRTIAGVEEGSGKSLGEALKE